MPRLTTSSANSGGVQWVTGRPLAPGPSQATARIRVTCSAVNLPGEPLRGQSFSTASIAREGGFLLAAFDQDQAIEGLGPAVTPGSDRMAFASDSRGDVVVAEAVEGQEDDPRPLGKGLGAGPGPGHGAQDGLLAFGDDELTRPPWHRS
jgi:hypothetical protein